MVDLTTISGRLKFAMKETRMDVAALARKSGKTFQGVTKIVEGRTKSMAQVTATVLGAAMEVRAEWLLYGTGDMLAPKEGESPAALAAPAGDAAELMALVQDLAAYPEMLKAAVASLRGMVAAAKSQEQPPLGGGFPATGTRGRA